MRRSRLAAGRRRVPLWDLRNGIVRLVMAMLGAVGISGASAASSAPAPDPLLAQFREPPDASRPLTWWHWMNGNVSRDGITADLEWMRQVGIAGFHLFDVSVGTPQFTEERIVYGSPAWQELVRHAADEAERLGLGMGLAIAPGFSGLGGPGVRPEQAMKKLVWSETRVAGPRRFAGALPPPPAVNGRFQGVPRSPDDVLTVPEPVGLAGARPSRADVRPPLPTHYRDVSVLAVRVGDAEPHVIERPPQVTWSGGATDADALFDDDDRSFASLTFPSGSRLGTLSVRYDTPVAVSYLTLIEAVTETTVGFTAGRFEAEVESGTWTTLAAVEPVSVLVGASPSRTYAFPRVVARKYRLVLEAPTSTILSIWLQKPPRHAVGLARLDIGAAPRVNRWEDKAQFGQMALFEPWATPAGDALVPRSQQDVVTLTAKIDSSGRLDWQVPPGEWLLLRFGYSLTGALNHPAQPEATGFEADKLSREHVGDYVAAFLERLRVAVGPHLGRSVHMLLVDSWEAGTQNWTDHMVEEFRHRRSYDPVPFLPVLTGRVVDSADVSDRFLWDLRRTIADLIAEHHYAHITELARTSSLEVYAEAMGTGAPTTGDGILSKGRVDVPMGEFWVLPQPGVLAAPHAADLVEAVSAGHVYGKPVVAAEAFTTLPSSLVPQLPAWGQAPFRLKPSADRAFALGINRMVFHTSTHQPFVDAAHRPGLTMGGFGQHFSRHITWAAEARAWTDYLARCSFLLQQGQPVVDVLYYYGEGVPATVPFWTAVEPALPDGYKADWIDTHALLERVSVNQGRLALPDGLTYRVLVLPSTLDRLSPVVVQRLASLVAAGATVVAPRPVSSPSLTGYPQADRTIHDVADAMWGELDGVRSTRRRHGAGTVVWGEPLAAVLGELGVPPDLEVEAREEGGSLVWTHRRTGDADLYFVANPEARAVKVKVQVRAGDRNPELWHPDTGRTEPADYLLDGGRLSVPLTLGPHGSVFIVQRGPLPARSRLTIRGREVPLSTMDGPWRVDLLPTHGPVAPLVFEQLVPWNTAPDPALKYFSGTARYSTRFEIATTTAATRLHVDLGMVRDIATVRVNGLPVGSVLWMPPYRVDVTDALQPGSNSLEIDVTNLWTNRLIGDAQSTVPVRSTFTDFVPFAADAPLLDSGLLGPVRLFGVHPDRRVTTAP